MEVNVEIMHVARVKIISTRFPLPLVRELFIYHLCGGNVIVLNMVTSTRCPSDLSNTSSTPLGRHLISTRERYFQAGFGEGELPLSVFVKFSTLRS